MSLSALPRGTYLTTYSLTITNDTPGVGEVVRCTVDGRDGASTPAAPRAVRLDNPGTNIATLAGQAKATFEPFGSHRGVVYLFCRPRRDGWHNVLRRCRSHNHRSTCHLTSMTHRR